MYVPFCFEGKRHFHKRKSLCYTWARAFIHISISMQYGVYMIKWLSVKQGKMVEFWAGKTLLGASAFTKHVSHKSLVCFRIEVLKVKTAPGIAKLVGVVACLTGAAILAFYKGPHLELLSHYNLLGYHKSQQHLGHVASSSWIKGCFLMLLSSTFWGMWLVLQVNFLPSQLMIFFLSWLFITFFNILVGNWPDFCH